MARQETEATAEPSPIPSEATRDVPVVGIGASADGPRAFGPDVDHGSRLSCRRGLARPRPVLGFVGLGERMQRGAASSGVGAPPDAAIPARGAPSGFTPICAVEEARLLGGTLELRSSAGEGTTMEVPMPWKESIS